LWIAALYQKKVEATFENAFFRKINLNLFAGNVFYLQNEFHDNQA
jgi:hypothetical protein